MMAIQGPTNFTEIPSHMGEALLSSAQFLGQDERKLYLTNCALVSKLWNSTLENVKVLFFNQGAITIGDFKKAQILPFLNRHAPRLHWIDFSKLSNMETESIIKFCPHQQSIKFPDNIGETPLQVVSQWTNLTALDLSGCFNIDNQLLKNFQNSTALTSLYLTGNMITDNGLESLAKLTNLTCLKLFAFCKNERLEMLRPLTNLTSLHLTDSKCSDAALNQLGHLPKLSILSLESYRTILSTGLCLPKDFDALTSLTFKKCKIGDEVFRRFFPLTKLTSLHFIECHCIQNTSLLHLTSVKNLSSLILDNCDRISDNAVPNLRKLTNIRHIDMVNCNRADRFIKK